MIICNIVGGLGNQMFQYLGGLNLAAQVGYDFKLSIDLFSYISGHNGYELERAFGIRTPIADHGEISQVLSLRRSCFFRRFALSHRLPSVLLGKTFITDYLENPAVRIAECRYAYVQGYWQQGFAGFDEDKIFSIFQFDPEVMDREFRQRLHARERVYVSVHFRRGDYLSKKNKRIFSVLDEDYYEQACRRFLSMFQDVVFIVFSDDLKSAEAFFQRKKFDFVISSNNRGVHSYKDMFAMSYCAHHIIANSTFSWWGAWLNRNPSKIVIYPLKWLVQDSVGKPFIPDGWYGL